MEIIAGVIFSLAWIFIGIRVYMRERYREKYWEGYRKNLKNKP